MTDHDQTFRAVDPASFDFVNARLACKTAWVAARPAREGERVTTLVRGAHIETTNTAHATDMVVTNPGGERYIIESRMFRDRYRATEIAGMYQPLGATVAVIPLAENVEFIAPWGQVMRILAGGVLVRTETGDIYGIQQAEFTASYEYVDGEA